MATTKKETTDASKELRKGHSAGGRVMAEKSVAVRQGAAKKEIIKAPTKKEVTDASKELRKGHSAGGRVMAEKSRSVTQPGPVRHRVADSATGTMKKSVRVAPVDPIPPRKK